MAVVLGVFSAFPQPWLERSGLLFFGTSLAWLAGSLVVFRFCGFRLIWRRAVWL